jgi:hypothetical protein
MYNLILPAKTNDYYFGTSVQPFIEDRSTSHMWDNAKSKESLSVSSPNHATQPPVEPFDAHHGDTAKQSHQTRQEFETETQK